MQITIDAPHSNGSLNSIKAVWKNIRWVPNDSTGEILNIGVIVVSEGQRHVKMLSGFDRIGCLYNSKFASDVKFLVKVVAEALLFDDKLPSANVRLSEPKFVSGESIDAILTQLFEVTVPLGVPRVDSVSVNELLRRVEPTETVREEVLVSLRRIAGVKADSIIYSERAMQVHGEDGRIHYLDIPLVTSRSLGTIVSARYKGVSANELRLWRADYDLQIARRLYSKDRFFMYVIRRSFERNAERNEDMLDEFQWKFRQVGVDMKTYTDSEDAARDILEDMSSAA